MEIPTRRPAYATGDKTVAPSSHDDPNTESETPGGNSATERLALEPAIRPEPTDGEAAASGPSILPGDTAIRPQTAARDCAVSNPLCPGTTEVPAFDTAPTAEEAATATASASTSADAPAASVRTHIPAENTAASGPYAQMPTGTPAVSAIRTGTSAAPSVRAIRPAGEVTGPQPAASPAPADIRSDAGFERRQRVFDWLDARGIRYTWYEHPEAPTCEIARFYSRGDGAKHCKNLFFRNHKGDRHYLVCFDSDRRLAIRDLELRLRQGKLSFASEQRMERWLGLRPGSVSPFGLINDPAHHVHLFLDERLRDWPLCAFHPNDNRATVVLAFDEFLRYLEAVGTSYEFIDLY